MRTFARTIVGVSLLALASQAAAQDPVAVAPDKYKVLFENEEVRVLEFRDKPGDKIPTHTHATNYLVYSFIPGKRGFTLPDGRTGQAEIQAGQVRWLAPVTHSEANLGTEGWHALLIELKGSGQ